MLRCCTKFFCVLAVIIFVVAGALTWIAVPIVLKKLISKQLELDKDNRIFEVWEMGSYPTEHGVYILSVQNPEEVIRGESPTMKEIGPYVFIHIRQKTNVVSDGPRWKYIETSRYVFNTTRSKDLTLDDQIQVLNAPLFAILYWAEKQDPSYLNVISANLNTMFPEGSGPILTTTVKKLLYAGIEVCGVGSPSAICSALTNDPNLKMITRSLNGDKWEFSFFHQYARTQAFEESFSIESGKDDTRLGEVVEWNGKREIDVWEAGGDCNKVQGSDGLLFPAFVEKSRMNVFRTDLCKTVPFYYGGKVSSSGKQYQFTTTREAFPEPTESDGTKCFCLKQTLPNDECVKNGAIDMNSCLGSHVVASAPHFWQGHQDYQGGVKGLSPNRENHTSLITLDYFFGFLMESKWRVQYNMFSRKVQNIGVTQDLKTTLFPIFWIDENVLIAPDLSEEVLKLFYKYYDWFETISLPVIVVSGVVALICIVILIFLCCVCNKKSR